MLLAPRDYLFGFHEWRQRHPGDSFEFETPLQGLGIGQQMAWLRQKVRGEPAISLSMAVTRNLQYPRKATTRAKRAALYAKVLVDAALSNDDIQWLIV